MKPSDNETDQSAAGDNDTAALSDEPLQLAQVLSAVSHPGAGAVVSFVGLVRNHHQGQTVTALEYEAYRSMARAELRAVCDQIESEMPEVRVAAVHRVGKLQVGDLAVVCAASAPHRQEAFRACQALIDRIKKRVPIWKKEHGAAGAHWVGWERAETDGGR